MGNKKNILNICNKHKNFVFFKSLGFKNYLSLVNLSDGVIGNSSSGVIEIPSLKKGTINIGQRQSGRSRSSSIIDCELNSLSIQNAIKKLYSKSFKRKILKVKNVYEKENSTQRIYNKILNLIKEKNQIKKFYLND